jgi:uncharacterized protein with HEPN domain
MRLEVRERLQHVVESCALIAGYTHGKTFDDYCEDRQLRDSVERHLPKLEAEVRGLLASPVQ